MDNTPPSRFDDDYINIDKVKKNLYTHTITYELARRNSYVEKSLNLLLDVFKIYESFIFPKYKAYLHDDKLNPLDIDLIKKLIIIEVEYFFKNRFMEDFETLTAENMLEKISYLVNTLIDELYNQYYIIFHYEENNSTCDFDLIYNSKKYLERDLALTKHIKIISEFGRNLYCQNFDYNENFSVYQDIQKNENQYSFNTIYPNFENPLRDFADTKIALNLNLPKDEIIDYIEKIKDAYDEKHSIIKTPRQLLEEELQENNNDTNTINEKWGDLFFIYDYYNYCSLFTNKQKTTIGEEIQIELTKYHGLKIKKTPDEKIKQKENDYKEVPWREICNEDSETNETNIFFGDDVKAYLSLKAISYKFKLAQKYIEGENPKYKTLINNSAY